MRETLSVADGLLIVGSFLVATGCWMIYHPAGIIVLGIEAAALGVIKLRAEQ